MQTMQFNTKGTQSLVIIQKVKKVTIKTRTITKCD